MTDEVTPLPRRGLPPADDGSDAPAPTRSRGRRFAEPPLADDDFFAAPPAPVLPASSVATPGRRFSADDLPDDWTPPPPRRSATSPSDYERIGLSPASPATIDDDNVLLNAGHRPPWVWFVIAAALALALGAGWLLQARPDQARPALTAQAVEATLAQPEELAVLHAGSTWTAASDLAPDETSGLRCIGPGIELRPVSPLASTTVRRTLSATEPVATVVQQVEVYADAAAARQGYGARLAQLGGCPGTPDRVLNGFALTGLGDEAGAVLVREQDAAATAHHLVVARAGRFVTLLDARGGATPPALDALTRAFQPSLARQCAASGDCAAGSASMGPAAPSVGPSADPPAGVPNGFLTAGDLPRVTPGVGVWIGARIEPITLSGTECEGVDLAKVAGATSAAQQAFLLKQDPNASANFGLDEVVNTFPTDAEAAAFATTLVANITDCTKRRPAATVTPLAKLPEPAIGQLFTVDRRTAIDKIARSRVLVGVQGNKVVYLAANPTPQFDLADEAWLGVLQRALARTKQA